MYSSLLQSRELTEQLLSESYDLFNEGKIIYRGVRILKASVPSLRVTTERILKSGFMLHIAASSTTKIDVFISFDFTSFDGQSMPLNSILSIVLTERNFPNVLFW